MNFDEKRHHYRKTEFPFLETCTWLNHAGHAPWSVSSMKAMDEFTRSFVYGPMRPYDDWNAMRERTRELLSELLNARPGEIGFNFTTSLCLSMLSHSIGWRPGDNIIAPDRSFPSIVMPAKLLAQDGVEPRVVPTVDGLADEERLLGAIDGRTRMMIVSLVDFLTGQRLDIPRLSKGCRDAGVFLVVDAIQAAGPTKIDVKALGCHALCFGSPKWMFGPMGVGTMYVDYDEIPKLKTVQVSMSSVPDPWNFFDYDQSFIPDCMRFECGCSAHLAHYGMKPNLEMFLDLGPENIERYLLDLTGEIHDALTARGVHVITPRDNARRAAIVTFDAKSAGWSDGQALLDALEKASIIVSLRMGLIRVSPHFYNNRDEIDRMLDVVFGYRR